MRNACAAAMVALGALGVLPIFGCGRRQASSAQQKPTVTEERADLRKKAETALPGKITGKGWHIPWRVRNPKNPNGPLLPILIADAETGEMSNQNAAPTIRLRGVHAKMYREGKPTANLNAAQITANRKDRILIGTGGVTLTSLTDPPDTVVTADKMTWDTRTSKIVASGHARVQRRQSNGERITSVGNRVTFDANDEKFQHLDME